MKSEVHTQLRVKFHTYPFKQHIRFPAQWEPPKKKFDDVILKTIGRLLTTPLVQKVGPTCPPHLLTSHPSVLHYHPPSISKHFFLTLFISLLLVISFINFISPLTISIADT